MSETSVNIMTENYLITLYRYFAGGVRWKGHMVGIRAHATSIWTLHSSYEVGNIF